MLKQIAARKSLPVFALSLTFGVAFGAPAAHAGFFEQLFGVQSAPETPSYDYQQPMQEAPVYRPRKKRVVVESKPVRQKVTDLMHDDTLHRGDAVMMKDGIHIYQGHETSGHDPEQFVALDDARGVSSTKRAALVAMDASRNDPLRGAISADTVASGRSAALSTPINPGFKITDARGKSLRYVGP